MMARRGVMGVLAGAATAALGGCGSRRRFNYKMTVEVETPQGLRSGYAVREINIDLGDGGWFPLGEGRGSVKVRGEAVAVDLPGGRVLFALLSGAGGNSGHASMDVVSLFRQLDSDQIELWPAMPETRAPRLGNPLPMLVTFRDLADPKSVERVDPADLATSFGDGVRLKRISIEKTGEDVTTGIGTRLGWLGGIRGALAHLAIKDYPPRGTSLPLAATLTASDFHQGLMQ